MSVIFCVQHYTCKKVFHLSQRATVTSPLNNSTVPSVNSTSAYQVKTAGCTYCPLKRPSQPCVGSPAAIFCAWNIWAPQHILHFSELAGLFQPEFMAKLFPRTFFSPSCFFRKSAIFFPAIANICPSVVLFGPSRT